MTVTLQHPRYQFDRYLAAGGMGEVWQATDTLLDREVAVKVLRRELAEDPVLRARFAAEARHAGALQHPHVASVLDYGEIVGQGTTPLPFLVMELVDGQPLSALLADGPPMAPQVAADLIAQAADGIEAAHAIGIVHRDVKPGNLLVTPYGQVKVTDFGVARAADTASLTTTGHLIGTPHYLSPEQAEGGSATTVSDVYSLGIVLFECLTGRKPFAAETPVATALMQIRDPLPAFPDSVPERLQRIARVATAKEPSHRFRSAGAMAAALRDDSPDTRTYLLPQPGAQSGARSAASGVVAAEQRHRELLSVRRVLVGLVALLLVTGGVWAMTASSDEPVGAPAAEASSEGGTELVRVRPKELVGLPVGKATRKLERLGLRPRTERQPNPGDEDAGTVAAVSPTGLLEPGSRVELSVWARPPAPPSGTAGDPSAASGGDGAGASGSGSAGTGAPSGQGGAGSSNGSSSGNAPGHSNAGGNGGGNGGGKAGGNGGGNGSSNAGSGNNNAGGNGGGNGSGNAGGNAGGGQAKPGKGGKR